MNRADFQINFIWPLIVFIGTFFVSDYSLNFACQVTVIYLFLAGLFRFSKMSYSLFSEIHKKHWKLSSAKKKGILSILTIFIFIAFAGGIFALDKTRYFSTQYALHKMDRAMRTIPAKTIETAMQQLKNNPNDMRYCSPMFFPSLNKNDPQAIATYIAYYALNTKYCDKFWDFGRENCGYLQEFNYGTNALEAKQNIRLCAFAKNNKLVKQVLAGGSYGEAQ